MEQESFLCGGVTLFHTLVDGKHCYEVGEVLTSQPSDFGRKGDKLMRINEVETQHVPPEKIARMLSSGSPLLTMHRTSINEAEKKGPESESMKPYFKEWTVLDFSLAMVRETGLDKDEENSKVSEEPERESSDPEGDSSTDEEILLVSMTNTSVAIMRARGCDAQNPCSRCGSTGCTLNDLVLAPKKSTVTSVCREYIRKCSERSQVLIQSLLQKSICPENVPRPRTKRIHIINSTRADITIYYYMSNVQGDLDKGAPVVLNFSGSTNFLKCIRVMDRPVLTVECCEDSKLRSVCKDDPSTWPFVFYMKTTQDHHHRFESAAYSADYTVPERYMEDEKNNECPESDGEKEDIVLHFHLAKVKDMYLGEKGEYLQKSEDPECNTGSTGSDCSVDEVLSKSESYGMTSGMTLCTYTTQCGIISGSQSICKYDERSQLLIQSLGHTIIHRDIFLPRGRRRAFISDKMTIYFYKSNLKDLPNSQPVVLNFSCSNQFLKCMYKNDKAVLTVECVEEDKLKSICKNDKTTWPFVFFLSRTKDNLCRFESAACSGWFIHARSDLVYACTRPEEKVEENAFAFIKEIQS